MPVFSNPPHTSFSGGHLDRADAQRQRPDWVDEQWRRPDARVLLFADLKPLASVDADLKLAWQFTEGDQTPADAVFLGLEEGRPCFAQPTNEADTLPGTKFVDTRSFATQLGQSAEDRGQCAIVAQARSLLGWHARHGFCANCGAETHRARGGTMRQCDSCSAQHFPRVDPVVIMLGVDGDRCLLGRAAPYPPGMYTALAGFMEQGESIEEAVRRELKEETGVTIGRVAYLASQPWPFPSTLMIGCIAEATDTRISLDDEELEDARWFSREETKLMLDLRHPDGLNVPPPVAIAHQLVRHWLEEEGT